MDSAARRNKPNVSMSLTVDASSSSPARPRLARAQISASAALEDVYRQHHRFVWRSLARLGVADERVPDAVHDVFMVVARRLAEFEARASMRTWLFAIAMRVAQSYRRDAARERRRRDRVGQRAEAVERPHARADAARQLHDMLDKLDDDKRAVFIMAELEGMTAPEISVVLDVKPATVYSRLRLAREQLERIVARTRARAQRRKP